MSDKITSRELAADPPPRWEQCTVRVLSMDLNREMADYGSKGWELVNAHPEGDVACRLFFKRRAR